MINIGLYLASEPHGGGAHQYNLSIISALELFDKTKYRVSVYCHDINWLDIVPKDFSLIIVKNPFILKVLSRLYKLIDTSAEGLRRHASFFNPLVKKINESDCEIVICPNQDALSYQCNKKTVTTIHDLMHRYGVLRLLSHYAGYENHFDEYRHGEIKRRDKHYTMICKYANCILVDSIVGRSHVYESYKIEHDRVFVLPFVAPSYLSNNKTIDVKKKYKLPDNYIFYPAQFWEHKNHIRLLEAIAILKNKNLDINLVLVG